MHTPVVSMTMSNNSAVVDYILNKYQTIKCRMHFMSESMRVENLIASKLNQLNVDYSNGFIFPFFLCAFSCFFGRHSVFFRLFDTI